MIQYNAYDEDISPYELEAIEAATQKSLEDFFAGDFPYELAELAAVEAATQESLPVS